MMRTEVLKVYRELLKATGKSFAGDTRKIKAFSMVIREKFEEIKNYNYSDECIQGYIDEAREAARLITDDARRVEMRAPTEHDEATLEVPSEEIKKNSA